MTRIYNGILKMSKKQWDLSLSLSLQRDILPFAESGAFDLSKMVVLKNF